MLPILLDSMLVRLTFYLRCRRWKTVPAWSGRCRIHQPETSMSWFRAIASRGLRHIPPEATRLRFSEKVSRSVSRRLLRWSIHSYAHFITTITFPRLQLRHLSVVSSGSPAFTRRRLLDLTRQRVASLTLSRWANGRFLSPMLPPLTRCLSPIRRVTRLGLSMLQPDVRLTPSGWGMNPLRLFGTIRASWLT